MAERRVTAFNLYGEPALWLLASATTAVALAVVARLPEVSRADFYTFWDAARWYREGVDPYFGHVLREGSGYNLNPPTLLLWFLPFSYLPLRSAFIVWFLLGLAAYLVAARSISRALTIGSTVLVLCGLLISQASFAAFQLGQMTPFLLPIFTAAWIMDRADRRWPSGILLGVLVALKPFLGVFGVYAIAVRRSAPMAAGMVAGALATWSIGLPLGGLAVYESWVRALQQSPPLSHLANASLLAAVSRALTTPPGAISIAPLVLAPGWVNPIWIGAVVLLMAVAARALLVRDSPVDRRWLLLGTSALLLSPLGWGYYAPLLAGPALGCWQSGPGSTRFWLVAGYLCLCVPYTVLQMGLGPIGTLLIGSIYTWGLVAWLVAALRVR